MAPPSMSEIYPPEYEFSISSFPPPPDADRPSHSEAFTSTLITIEVGSDDIKRTFQIRRGILTFYSGYFAAALSGRFAEAEENMCRLPEEDPIIFEMFQHWMQDRTLYESTLEPALLLSYLQTAQLWTFSDAQDIPALKNKAIDILARKRSLTKGPITRECGQHILKNTLESSPLRTLVCELTPWVSSLCTSLVGEKFDLVVRALPHAAQIEVPQYQKQGPFASITDMCRFHVHGDGDSCRKS